MNKIKLLLPLVVLTVAICSGCNSGNNDSSTSKETMEQKDTSMDTTLNKDSIHVDPENFSDPH